MMKLSSLINPELVLLKRPCKTRDELLDELIRELYHGGQKVSIPENILRGAITDRENLGGTLLPTGLAIPHARLDGFDDFILAVGIPASPIQGTAQGEPPVRMMVLMLTSMSSSTQYLNTLASLAKISQGPLFSTLCGAANQNAFIEILKDANIEIAGDLTVASIMKTILTVLHTDNTVKEAADMFYKNHLGYLPVLDRNDAFVGELTVLDLFSVGIPDYALKMENLKFLTRFEPFDELLKNENSIRIGDVMKKPEITLEEDSPVIEAVLKFIRCKRRYLPVVKNKTRLTGVVGYMDILKKVLRA
jgi:PTS system nitrogen regulatory IIA component